MKVEISNKGKLENSQITRKLKHIPEKPMNQSRNEKGNFRIILRQMNMKHT